jgi:hypothetical protein
MLRTLLTNGLESRLMVTPGVSCASLSGGDRCSARRSESTQGKLDTCPEGILCKIARFSDRLALLARSGPVMVY